jgi:hypothetical protein
MRELNLVRSRLPPSVTALERGDGFPHGSRRHIDVRRSQCLRQTSGGTIGGSKSAHTRRGPLAKCLDHRKAPLLPLEELREEVGQPLSGGPLSRAAARAPCRSMQLLIARPWCRSGDWFEILLHEAVDLRPNRRCANTDTAIVESADPIVARRKAGERDLSLSISRSPPLALCVVSNEGYGCTFQGPSGRSAGLRQLFSGNARTEPGDPGRTTRPRILHSHSPRRLPAEVLEHPHLQPFSSHAEPCAAGGLFRVSEKVELTVWVAITRPQASGDRSRVPLSLGSEKSGQRNPTSSS